MLFSKTDQFGNPIYTIDDFLNIVYQDGLDNIENCNFESCSDIERYQKLLAEYKFAYPRITEHKNITHIPIEDFDSVCQSVWFMPDEYKNMDIEGFLVDQCPKQNYQRLIEEIRLFKTNNMINLLKYMKYLVDTMRSNNIVWGVGRGSSVSSYALYLIGVHNIDCVKYDLDYKEFFK